jgi:hypothetical protein
MKDKKNVQGFNLPGSILGKLKATAKKKKWSLSQLARVIFTNYFDKKKGD